MFGSLNRIWNVVKNAVKTQDLMILPYAVFLSSSSKRNSIWSVHEWRWRPGVACVACDSSRFNFWLKSYLRYRARLKVRSWVKFWFRLCVHAAWKVIPSDGVQYCLRSVESESWPLGVINGNFRSLVLHSKVAIQVITLNKNIPNPKTTLIIWVNTNHGHLGLGENLV